MQSNGYIVGAGLSDNNFLLFRNDTTGTLDSTFGLNGLVVNPIGLSIASATSTTNYAFAYDTTSQAVITTGTFQDVTFDTNVQLNG